MRLFEKDLSKEQISNIKNLINSLKSNRYKQGKGVLHQGDSFCCLGVACDLIDKDRWEESKDDDLSDCYTYMGLDGTLPKAIQIKYGFWGDNADLAREYTGERIRSLTNLNDNGRSFKDIANIIEHELKKNFARSSCDGEIHEKTGYDLARLYDVGEESKDFYDYITFVNKNCLPCQSYELFFSLRKGSKIACLHYLKNNEKTDIATSLACGFIKKMSKQIII